jgi:hypothetical protein
MSIFNNAVPRKSGGTGYSAGDGRTMDTGLRRYDPLMDSAIQYAVAGRRRRPCAPQPRHKAGTLTHPALSMPTSIYGVAQLQPRLS